MPAIPDSASSDKSSLADFQSQFDRTLRDLADRADRLAAEFARAEPFPHLVIDDFLPAAVAEQLEAEFPEPDTEVWRNLKGFDMGGKQVLGNDQFLRGTLRLIIQELNSGSTLRVLEQITGVRNLIADGKLLGGGLHQIRPGGRLNVHVDYSHHPETQLNRRLNLLLYLNKDWPEEYGGHFEMWDRDRTRYVRRVLPVYNRCVIFATSPYSYHGHPEPLTCPPNRTRKSIALYYYTQGRPEAPGDVVEHNTLFYQRPGERLKLQNYLLRAASGSWLRELLPPILYRGLRKAWNALTLTKR